MQAVHQKSSRTSWAQRLTTCLAYRSEHVFSNWLTCTAVWPPIPNPAKLCLCQASQKQVQQQCDLFKKEAETAQRQVQDYVQQKQKREAELYVKVGRSA